MTRVPPGRRIRLSPSFETAATRLPQDEDIRSGRGITYLMLTSAPRGASRSMHDGPFSIGYRHRQTGRGLVMRRRDVLKAAGAGLAALAAPRIGRPDKLNKLVFVPTEDLSVLDPVVTTLKSTRNHGYLVFDTLYGIDTNWMAQPQ